jgi:hypothetical protein
MPGNLDFSASSVVRDVKGSFSQPQSSQQGLSLILENYKACCCDERSGIVESSTTAVVLGVYGYSF